MWSSVKTRPYGVVRRSAASQATFGGVADEQPASSPDPNPPDLEQLLATLRDRIERRRAVGEYPPGVEADLDAHFARLTGDRPPTPAFLLAELDEALDALEHFEFGQAGIGVDSRIPGGSLLHRAVAKGVSRQIQGVFEQTQQQSHLVARTIALTARAANLLADAYDTRVIQQLDDLQTQLAEEQGRLQQLLVRVTEVAARVPGAGLDAWYEADAFNAHFRGPHDDIVDRYRDLAARFVGCDPVLDIGFGRGEFLELLRELGVEARGIETEPRLVEWAQSRGLKADVGRAVEYLSRLDADSLGGLVMIQVIEHLSPQHVIDVVRLAAEVVRPGGRVVVETVNPMSLYTYAHAFWVDPDHVRPVHPNYLGFLFAEAGFATVERVDRSPVPADETLELMPGDDELSKRLNANFERINALLFGPQDYAIVATR
jgi:2-polyprenyl-3-methyl-5-hydroxy-6-metoxy-1,4-benzoquinol methylase